MGDYFGFSGRVGRGYYWTISLITITAWIGFTVVAGEAGVAFLFAPFLALLGIDSVSLVGDQPKAIMATGYALLVLAPWLNISAAIRRYHDRGKSGWWYFVMLVPFIGPIWQLIELGFLAGDSGTNRFGPPPGSPEGRTSAAFAKIDDAGIADFGDIDTKIAMMKAKREEMERAQKSGQPASRPAGGHGARPTFGRRTA